MLCWCPDFCSAIHPEAAPCIHSSYFTQTLDEARNQFSPRVLGGNTALLIMILDFWPSELWENVLLLLRSLVRGDWLQQSQETNTVHQISLLTDPLLLTEYKAASS